MKESKKIYYAKAETIFKENLYFSQIEINCIDNSLIQKLILLAKQKNIKYIKSKYNIFNKISSIVKGNTLILFSKNKQDLILFLKEHALKSYSYYNKNDMAQEDIIIPKGNLRIKAGTTLSLFEKYGSIKLTKGMIELLKPMDLILKGEPITEDISKILKILDKKIKVNFSKIISFYDIKNKNYFSPEAIETIFYDNIEHKLSKAIKLVGFCSENSFNNNIPRKIAGIITAIPMELLFQNKYNL